MDGNIKQTYEISMKCTENELHDLLLELKSIVNNELEDDFDQYQETRKLYNSIYRWLADMAEMKIL